MWAIEVESFGVSYPIVSQQISIATPVPFVTLVNIAIMHEWFQS